MPWEKDFDVEQAVDRAMQVFWAKGYEPSSVAELAAAMEINKGSLYNAFGSKKALFQRALLKYDVENRQATLKELETWEDPVAAIRELFDLLLAESRRDRECKGCLLVNTALDLPNHDEDIQRLVTEAMKNFELFFERAIERAQERGQVSADLDPKGLAKSLLAQVVGLRVLSRGAFDSKGLESIRAQALGQISQ